MVATASENRLTDYQASGAMDSFTSAQRVHLQHCAEFLPFRSRALGPLTVTVLRHSARQEGRRYRVSARA
jgi:hypothetical protein